MGVEGKFCTKPFDNFEVLSNGAVSVCCTMWLPDIIGNVNWQEMPEIFNSDVAKRLRASIIDGSFRYCNHQTCPFIASDGLPSREEYAHIERYQNVEVDYPLIVVFCNDTSCNLSCPSCRTSIINLIGGEEFDKLKNSNQKLIDYVLEGAKKFPDRKIIMHITGSGDPFASKVYRDFLLNFDGYAHPNVKISLQTNGVMFTEKYWNMMERVRENIFCILVSFDAACEETYKITRRGGNWNLLNENFRMLGEKRRAGLIETLRADFVVQDHNFREMPDFIDLLEDVGHDSYLFQKIMNWGTFSEMEFSKRAIWKADHPDHQDFLEVLKDPRLQNDKVVLGNIAPYLK